MRRTKKQAQLYQDSHKNSCPTCDQPPSDAPQPQLHPEFSELFEDDSFIPLQVQSQSQFDYLNESSPHFSGCLCLHGDPLDSDQHPLNSPFDALQAFLRPSLEQDPSNGCKSNLETSPSNMSTLRQNQIQSQIIPNDDQLLCQSLQSCAEPQEAREASFVGLKIDLDNIFEERPIQRTRNLTKAIRKYIDRHLSKYQDHFQGHKDFFKKMKKQLRESKDEYFSLDDMARIFSGGVVPEGLRNLPRLVIRKILNRWLRKSIIPNNQVKDKLTYLVATKVYSIRCRSSQLSSRVQMR